VIDDINAPKANVAMTITSLPATVPYSATTNSSGIWMVIDKAFVRDS
jgi:hypothetical protein